MTEKLNQPPSLERADENQELQQEILANRLIHVLREMNQPLRWDEIHLLAETDGLGDINIEEAKISLDEMTQRGVIIRVAAGVYALPEFAPAGPEVANKAILEERVKIVLGQAGRPLRRAELEQSVGLDGYGLPANSSIRACLAHMIRKGEISRIDRGVYSLPEFASEEYTLPRVALRERVETVLRQAERPLHKQDIYEQVEADGHRGISLGRLGPDLSRMINAGRIVRTEPGLYCLPEFADKTYEPPKLNNIERTVEVLWQAGQPLHKQDICGRIEAGGETNIESISPTLSRMVHRKLIVRTNRGVYSLPEFSFASERKSDSYVSKAEVINKVVNILNEVGGSSSGYHIYLLLAVGNLKGLSLEQASNLLGRMADKNEPRRRIVRTAEDTYCLSELADTEYENPLLKIEDRALVILQAALRPLHYQDICRLSEKEEQGEIKLQSIRPALSHLVDQGAVTRVARSIYSIPEFADEHYELPKLDTELRIDLSLSEAARPLRVTEIHRLVNTDDQIEASLGSVYKRLHLMAQEDKIIRVDKGVYALPEFTDL